MNFIQSINILTAALAAEYQNLFNSAQVKPEAVSKVDAAYKKMLAYQARYEAVARAINLPGVPWYLIAVIHMRESSFSFSGHLHNGDALTGRTTHVPAGHPIPAPAAGVGKPYAWEESATDAISMMLYDPNFRDPSWYNYKNDSSIPSILNKIENYNGAGYRSRQIPSPYLWSDSTLQQPGKFTSDNRFNRNVIDTQVGAATLLKYFLEKDAKKK